MLDLPLTPKAFAFRTGDICIPVTAKSADEAVKLAMATYLAKWQDDENLKIEKVYSVHVENGGPDEVVFGYTLDQFTRHGVKLKATLSD